jgi:DNA-directed RNA polymerase subunit RPC12/RpoP
MIKCPKCGAGMYFDIKLQMLKCRSCGSRISVSDYKTDINAEEHIFETPVYICKSCGAQLKAPDEQATAFCPYCGNQSMIPSKLKSFYTNRIIPFKKTKEDIEKNFANYTKKKLFVPDDYKPVGGENEFRGVYIPYYNYKVNYKPGTVTVDGSKDYDEGNRHHHMIFLNEVTTDGGTSEDIVRDASKAFDDSLAKAIAPYSHDESVTFREGYLGDFYADIPTVNPEIYNTEVVEEAVDEMKIGIEKACNYEGMKFEFKDEILASRVEKNGVRADLYPVWFLTHKATGGRVAYAVANGQTGKMAMDLPVSRHKFFIAVSLITVVLFALFSFVFGYMTPSTLTGVCALTESFSLLALCAAVGRVFIRERNAVSAEKAPEDDLTGKAKKKVKEKFGSRAAAGSTLVTAGIISIYAFKIIHATGIIANAAVLISLIALIIAAFSCVYLAGKGRAYSGFSKYSVNAFVSAAVIVGCIVLMIIKPFQDWIYITASLITQALVTANCLTVISLFDRVCTHAAPGFYTREGASKDEN